MKEKQPAASSYLLGYSLHGKNARSLGFSQKAETGSSGGEPFLSVYYQGDSHLMTFAPTGAGKGVSTVIPNCLHYSGQLVVVDIKGECKAITSRRRKEMGQQVRYLEPFSAATTDRLNVFDIFDLPNSSVEDDSEMLAEAIAAGYKGTKEPFWDQSAMMLLSGVIAYVASTQAPEKRNMGTVIDILMDSDVVYRIATIADYEKAKLLPSIYQKFASFLQVPDQQTRPSVIATVVSYINSLMGENIRNALNTSTLNLDDLRTGTPLTVYITIPPDKLQSHKALLKLWIAVLLKTVMSRTVIPAQKTLFLIDETAQLGHFQYLQTVITLCRGYGLQCWTVWQDLQQVKQNYPHEWETLINNSAVLQFFGVSNYLSAKAIEQVTGILPSLIYSLQSDEQIILQGNLPVIARKLNYLTDPLFKGKFDANPFYLNNTGDGIVWPSGRSVN
jgi:type IV secretion system protein VirD4